MIRDNAVYMMQSLIQPSAMNSSIGFLIRSNLILKTRISLLEQTSAQEYNPFPECTHEHRAKISAEQDAQKMQFVLQKERQEAERKRVESPGNCRLPENHQRKSDGPPAAIQSIKAQLESCKITQ
jgi:hypothetical protein